MKYVYPAIFYEANEGGYVVEFPDVQGCVTQGENLYDAIFMAEDVLSLILVEWEERKAKGEVFNNRIDEPTPIEKVVAVPDEFSSKAFVTLIKADTDAYRKMLEGAA